MTAFTIRRAAFAPVSAATLSILMARQGPVLNGGAFVASTTQVERWLVAAVAEPPAL